MLKRLLTAGVKNEEERLKGVMKGWKFPMENIFNSKNEGYKNEEGNERQ